MSGYKVRVQRHLRRTLVFASLFLGALTAGAAPRIFINIDVPFPGAVGTSAEAINASGQVVGSYGLGSNYRAFLWYQGAFTPIDPPGAVKAQARDINDSGQVVGFYIDGGGKSHGFLWDNGTSTTIDPPDAISAGAWAINSSGQIVGNYLDSLAGHGFLWDQGTFTQIDVPGFGVLATAVSDINATGQIIGSYFVDPDFLGAFLWDGGNFSFLGPGDASTGPAAINDAGQIVGSYDPTPQGDPTETHAFMIPNGNPNIDPPGAVPGPSGFVASAVDINAAGLVVGYYLDNTQTQRGFLLQGGAFTKIDPPSSVHAITAGINQAGDIVGGYLNSSGTHGFVARSASVVNGLVHLNSATTAFDATPVPGGPAGTFTIRSNFTNTSAVTMDAAQFAVIQLSNGNLLLNADVVPGGVNARLTPDLGSDGVFSPGESFDVQFVIGLQQKRSFAFRVDLLGAAGP